MLPPIPDPNPPQVIFPRGPRPAVLKHLVGSSLFLSAAGLVFCDSTMTEWSVAADLAVYGFATILWLVILWCLWQGQNWARILTMIGCVINVFSLAAIGDYQGTLAPLQIGLTIINAIWGMVFFWPLRSPQMLAFCNGQEV